MSLLQMNLGLVWDIRDEASVVDLGFLSCVAVADRVPVVFY